MPAAPTADLPQAPAPGERPQRDSNGRFVKGNRGGPGNPRIRRQAEYLRAVRDAVRPDHLRLVLQRMVQLAVKDGNVCAARLIAERCLGPVSLDPVGEGVPVELPRIQGFGDLLRVTELLLQATVNGDAPVETIEKLSKIVEGVRKVYETEVLDERVRELAEDIRRMREDPARA